MRRGHLIILFALLFVLLLLGAVEGAVSYDMADRQKQKIDNTLLVASDAAAERLVEEYGNENYADYLESAKETFFRALSAGLNIYDDLDEIESLDFYVPLLLVTKNEGYYMNYLTIEEENGAKTLKRVWTECQPYMYADDTFIFRFCLNDDVYIIRKSNPTDSVKTSYEEVVSNNSLASQVASSGVFDSAEAFREKKRQAIAYSIEQGAGRIINEHNYVAGQFGLTMYYGVPSFFDDYTPATEYPSFLAVFQGYPLSLRHRLVYSNCATSASYIAKKAWYVVENPNRLDQPFAIFHKQDCLKIGTYGTVLQGKYSLDEAVSKHGAYACPYCFDESEGVPVLP